jgi:RNA polymerase sigma-70 factor, ECF subfamily
MQNQAEQIADEILVMDAQRGCREAFDMLVSRWQKRLWWHALNLTGHTETAWDITQESWLDIVRGLTRLNDPAKFGSWAYRIVSHKAYDKRSRDGRDYSPAIEPEDTPTVTAGQIKQETASDVCDILRRLSARAQVVLNLYYLEGFSLAEIADILGTPEGTVKSSLHAARIEFREHWESHGRRLPAAIPASGKE